MLYPLLDSEKYLALCEIQKFAGWDPPSPEDLARVKESFLKKYPMDQELVQMAESNGRLYRELLDSGYRLGFLENGVGILLEQIFKTGVPDS